MRLEKFQWNVQQINYEVLTIFSLFKLSLFAKLTFEKISSRAVNSVFQCQTRDREDLQF